MLLKLKQKSVVNN